MGFNTGVSGLQAAAGNLDVIGNNIANSSTIGFKGSRANFGDIYSSTTGAGGGVMLTKVQQSFNAGNMTNTNRVLDLAIEGDNSFFVLNAQGSQIYSRAGQFQPDAENYIVNSSGQNLTGYLADELGNITGLKGDLRINTSQLTPQATSRVTGGYNFNAKATPPSVDWTGGPTPLNSTYNNATSLTVYDSLGNSHVLSMYFMMANSDPAASANAASPAGTTNQWYVAFQIDNQDVPAVSPGANANNLYAANFNPDGTFASLQLPGGGPTTNNLASLSMPLANGANPLNIEVDLTSCSQFGSPFSTQTSHADGYETGIYAGLQIDRSGVVYCGYSNGQTLAMGQIQLANFANPEGLQNVGNVAWSATAESGQPLIGVGSTGNFGQIFQGRLEESNVDLTSSLVDLIGAQRDFQANAQSIRTTDAITQTIINMR